MTTERRGAARLLRNVALVDHPLPFHANRAFERADSVALAVLGQPSSKSHRGLRWGRHGSISMRLRGDKRGFWHDFERGEGGDVLDLIARQQPVERLAVGDLVLFQMAGAYAWNISHHDFLMHPKPTVHYLD